MGVMDTVIAKLREMKAKKAVRDAAYNEAYEKEYIKGLAKKAKADVQRKLNPPKRTPTNSTEEVPKKTLQIGM